jgi:hypothetical protein
MRITYIAVALMVALCSTAMAVWTPPTTIGALEPGQTVTTGYAGGSFLASDDSIDNFDAEIIIAPEDDVVVVSGNDEYRFDYATAELEIFDAEDGKQTADKAIVLDETGYVFRDPAAVVCPACADNPAVFAQVGLTATGLMTDASLVDEYDGDPWVEFEVLGGESEVAMDGIAINFDLENNPEELETGAWIEPWGNWAEENTELVGFLGQVASDTTMTIQGDGSPGVTTAHVKTEATGAAILPPGVDLEVWGTGESEAVWYFNYWM